MVNGEALYIPVPSVVVQVSITNVCSLGHLINMLGQR